MSMHFEVEKNVITARIMNESSLILVHILISVLVPKILPVF